MPERKQIYFASDFHLGIPNHTASLQREKKIVSWLQSIHSDAHEIYLLGDIFDFWWEYKKVIPKGFVRLQGKLAEICDSGIPVHYFLGNHDQWQNTYFTDEIGLIIHHHPIEKEILGKQFFIGHGDGLGPGDRGYKVLKRLFHSSIARWLFTRLHPNSALYLAHKWSKKSRYAHGGDVLPFSSAEDEWLFRFCQSKLQQQYFDYFVFGHRHIPLNLPLNQGSRYINLGDWIQHFSYAKFDGENMAIHSFNA